MDGDFNVVWDTKDQYGSEGALFRQPNGTFDLLVRQVSSGRLCLLNLSKKQMKDLLEAIGGEIGYFKT